MNPVPEAEPTDSDQELRRERDALLETVRELTHLQLISRDTEIGLRAELLQARLDLDHAEARAAQMVADLRRSPTWRMGRIVTKPLGAGRRVFRQGK